MCRGLHLPIDDRLTDTHKHEQCNNGERSEIRVYHCPRGSNMGLLRTASNAVQYQRADPKYLRAIFEILSQIRGRTLDTQPTTLEESRQR